MALIKCTECEAGVSEKASVCPKCGCPIEVSIDNIKKYKKNNQRKVIIGIIVLIIVAIIGIGVYKFITKPDTSGYYNGFKWGITYEEVKKQIGDDAIYDDEKNLLL